MRYKEKASDGNEKELNGNEKEFRENGNQNHNRYHLNKESIFNEYQGIESDELEFYEMSFREEGEPVISSAIKRAKIGTLIFIIAEIMYFGGLISTFFVMKKSAVEWPPPEQPRYPVIQTAFNTLFLIASGLMIYLFGKTRIRFLFLISAVLGAIFVLLQGVEWARLVAYGLTMTSSQYASIFYLVVGSHAIHAVAGLIWMWIAYIKSRDEEGFLTPSVESAQLFWKFVVLIWPVIYLSLYIS